MNVSDIPDKLQDQFYDHQNHSSARDAFQKMALSQSAAEPGGGGGATAPLPHWHVDQNAELDKYHAFSSFETVLCTGMD